MRKLLAPIRDASIYEEFSNRNAGRDEILEVGKSESGVYRIRSVIQFSPIEDIPIDAEYTLKLFSANVQNLNRDKYIRAIAISQSWDEGDGYYYQDVIQNMTGATWDSASNQSAWAETGSIPPNPTETSSIFNPIPSNKDFSINVTDIVRSYISESITPSWVIALDDVEELDTTVKTNIKFFSSNTHTIYSPMLVATWDDQVYNTASLAALQTTQTHVQPINLKAAYTLGEVATVSLIVRDKYPQKTFAMSGSAYSRQCALPQTSYFRIVDAASNVEIIPFSDSSKISSDGSTYFRFRIEGMYPLRYYKVSFKLVFDDGRVEIIDDNYMFTVKL